jgi:APA family basic amino acid/polyamine antiporter
MKPTYAGIGLGIVLTGVPLYYLAVRTKKTA